MYPNVGHVYIFGVGAFNGKNYLSELPLPHSEVTKIFTLIDRPRNSWLPECLTAAQVVLVSGEYTNPDRRIDNYKRVAERVLNSARNGEKVAYCAIGSPVVFDRVTGLIRHACTREGIACTVFPATSSVDAMLSFLGEDMAPALQVSEARWATNNGLELDPKAATVLFQVGAFWTDGIADPSAYDASKLFPLRDYLSRHYPKYHFAIFVRAPFHATDKPYFRCTQIGRIGTGVAEDMMGTSLFIPSLDDPDRAFKSWYIRAKELLVS